MNCYNNYRYKVWLRQAQFDLNAANISIKYGFYEWACFQAEQAAEKALKAIIVYHGKSAPKLHKLGILLGIIKNLEPKLRKVHLEIGNLQTFTFTSRYPFLIPGSFETPHDYIQYKDAKICLAQAKKILKLTKKLLKD